MKIREALHRFYLKDEAVFDAQIDAKRIRKPHIVEYDIDRRLPVDLQTSSQQRSFEYRFIDAFKQSWAELPMDSNTFLYNHPGQLIQVFALHLRAPVPL